ncbi:MAG: hemolysin family protein [Planctomycetota bacterium]|nr:hemolysin family protein [Planctomycetota bacterium]
MFLLVFAVSFALIASFFCSLAEATLLSVGKARVEQLVAGGSRAGRILRRFKQQPDTPIAAILILNTVAHTAGAAVAGAAFATEFGDQNDVLFVVGFTIAVLLFSEIVPKTMGVVYASRLAGPIAHTVNWLALALTPVIYLTRLLSKLFHRGEPGDQASLEEIRLLVAAGHSEGAFGAMTADIIANATRLRELRVHHVMVARNRVSYLSATRSVQENLDRIRRTGHSRFPFSPTGELDDTKGVILTKELLFHLRDNPEPDWDALLVPPFVVPESAQLNHVLREFQRQKRHMALVVDEYGAVQGVLTLEDVLEEIVGEIQDEQDDRDESHMIVRPDGSVVCRGIAEVRKVFAALKLPDAPTNSQTVSGFLTDQTGEVPTVGLDVHYRGHRFLVTKANSRHAERVRITPLPGDTPESTNNGQNQDD